MIFPEQNNLMNRANFLISIVGIDIPRLERIEVVEFAIVMYSTWLFISKSTSSQK